ncbi:LysR family transcriptional regulator [Poseidonocella sp. HB161398]|uniref:LysR family transcriptional regulator n=1 Tax=Poseidonocella sp. HB161398 TaxID=2320855 RepID=UPI001F100677|nr:LysR family transcriptional regulator [Poseidonocella sp. HB161398]
MSRMKRDELGDLAVFMAVAEECSFTRAATRMGVSQSAISHTVRRLEGSIGVKLLNRSSRKVTITDAGEKLLAALRPGFGQVEARIEELRLLGDAPKGLIRVTTGRAAARTVLWPVVNQLVRDYPEICVEVSTDPKLADLTEDRFDCGIRLGEYVGPDMIAVRVGPRIRLAAVGSPEYFKKYPAPQHPSELDDHRCIALRFNVHDAPYDWEFEKDGEEIVKRISGPFIFNDSTMAIDAARMGHGICFVTEAEVSEDIEEGSLRRVLTDWCPEFEGFHLFYAGRRQVTSAMRLLIDRLRYRE